MADVGEKREGGVAGELVLLLNTVLTQHTPPTPNPYLLYSECTCSLGIHR
jgi:hypothetical protein